METTPLTAENFKAAMASFAASVTIITTLDARGEPEAVTATAFSSVSLDPPLCLVCIDRRGRTHRPLVRQGQFGVNILRHDQQWLSERFAGGDQDRFSGVQWQPGPLTRCPLLRAALACMECEVVDVHAGGDHDIFVAKPLAVRVQEGTPLVYFRGSYTSLPPASASGSDVATTSGALPDELAVHVAEERYETHSEAAHDVWREVLRRNDELVRELAPRMYPGYVEGRRELALSNRIPRVEELNRRLEPTGWRVVPVNGYIPSAIYAGLMSRQIFPVSRVIRRAEHLDFAPAPDMAHDILGHLPLLYCAEYRRFLKRLASKMARATPNHLDLEFFEAVRSLARLKSDPASGPRDLARAAARLERVHIALRADPSEVTYLRRMYVWSIEFGLLGDKDHFSVHGAALLSSPTEFRALCAGRARLLPFSLDVIRYENAFSEVLGQYFVAPTFSALLDVLAEYEALAGLAKKFVGDAEVFEGSPDSCKKEKAGA
jgi:flavin reductase (DIM6/NTAB) family NADH-FMN oxidoreductase RutF/phenylalanine-4-hydroxylase